MLIDETCTQKGIIFCLGLNFCLSLGGLILDLDGLNFCGLSLNVLGLSHNGLNFCDLGLDLLGLPFLLVPTLLVAISLISIFPMDGFIDLLP